LDLIILTGTPYEMGVQHGRQLRDEIHALADDRLRLCLTDMEAVGSSVGEAECLALARTHLPFFEKHAPLAWAEFQGIADGAGISLERLFVGNGYTDFVDVLMLKQAAAELGCTAFLVRREFSHSGHTLLGQTWDMHPSAKQFVHLFQREPTEGAASLVLSTAGCLSLIGLNAAGIAIGNNNLCPLDARPGLMYLTLIHQALAQITLDAAIAGITAGPRASGHNYLLADADRIVDIETTALEYELLEPAAPWYVHTNHYRTKRLAVQEMQIPSPSSTRRLERMEVLLASATTVDVDTLWTFMSDRTDAENPICRLPSTDDESVTCAAVIVRPETGEMWAARGDPLHNAYAYYKLPQ